MKTIVHRSAAIVTFLGLLGLSLHAPQMSHLARFADLLVVAPRRKTLAQLAAQELDGVDPSNLADFFRISPWDPDDVRLPLIEFILTYLKRHHQLHGLPLYFTLDDSLTPKDKGTHKLQGVVKLQLGLGDFRLQDYEAIARWYAVVYLVLVYLYWQRYEHESRHGASTSLSEVLARLRQDHQREVLRAACAEVPRGAAVEEVVERYMGPATGSAA